jgi:hypothetical protein
MDAASPMAATGGDTPVTPGMLETPTPTAVSPNSFSLFGPAPVLPSQSPLAMGPPKCPICRQVFHSLLAINLPQANNGAEGNEVSIDVGQ